MRVFAWRLQIMLGLDNIRNCVIVASERRSVGNVPQRPLFARLRLCRPLLGSLPLLDGIRVVVSLHFANF